MFMNLYTIYWLLRHPVICCFDNVEQEKKKIGCINVYALSLHSKLGKPAKTNVGSAE